MARLSVIVTSYNIEDYLEACLDSILAQTLQDLEIIVVDDGSTDSSPDIIRRYAERDDRVVPLILEDNSIGGVATAANAGLDQATADWVGFADGDDLYEPEMFDRLLTAAESAGTDLAMCDYLLLDDSTGESEPPADARRWSELDRSHYELDVATRKQFLRFIAVPWRKIYRRALLEDEGLRFPVGDYFYEDNPFHWFSLVTARSIAVVPEVLCHHRVARVGQTMATVDARLFKIFEHHETILAWLEARGVDRIYRPTLLAWAMSQMEWISRRTPEELRGELFEVLRGVFGHYDRETIDAALTEGAKGATARSLSLAIEADNIASFHRILDHRDTEASPLDSAMYHLRHSGVRKTAQVTGRFAANRARKALRKVSPRTGATSSGAAQPSARVSSSDLAFALLVIDQRLEAIEGQLQQLTSGQGVDGSPKGN